MGLRGSSVLLIACLACLGLDHNLASSATPTHAVRGFKLAQDSTNTVNISTLLQPGSTGTEVRTLQTSLKELGYYDGEIDGKYGAVTRMAVAKFQQAKGLVADGVFGTVTKQNLEQKIKRKSLTPSMAVASNAIPASATTEQEEKQDIVWWLLATMGTLGSLGALAYIIKGFSQVKTPANYIETSRQENTNSVTPSRQENTTATSQGYLRSTELIPQETVANPQTQLLSVEKTSRLAKVNIIDQLIQDLHSADPTQRRKAIWDLGQQGDSRAVQPLVELMVDADTQQRSLILAALAEIGTRTLKPMNRALAISLQDESPQVRKNAIRDLTRIYDMMAQVSQMVSHAMHDPDAEVQATAKYALSQMNRLRSLPSQDREDQRKDEG